MLDIKNGWVWCVKQLEVMIESGGFTPGEAVADATDETDVVAQFNALVASLRTAGVIEQ